MGGPIPSEGNFQQRIAIFENLGFFAFDRKKFSPNCPKIDCPNLSQPISGRNNGVFDATASG
jgi:hypothetical protein